MSSCVCSRNPAGTECLTLTPVGPASCKGRGRPPLGSGLACPLHPASSVPSGAWPHISSLWPHLSTWFKPEKRLRTLILTAQLQPPAPLFGFPATAPTWTATLKCGSFQLPSQQSQSVPDLNCLWKNLTMHPSFWVFLLHQDSCPGSPVP